MIVAAVTLLLALADRPAAAASWDGDAVLFWLAALAFVEIVIFS